MIKNLSRHECDALLRANSFGRLGCIIPTGMNMGMANGGRIHGPAPYVVPINYVYEDEFAYSHTLSGSKLNFMRRNPQVCLQVDEVKDSFHWQSVLAYGKFTEISMPWVRREVISKLLGALPDATPVETRLVEMEESRELVVFAIHVTAMSGRVESSE